MIYMKVLCMSGSHILGSSSDLATVQLEFFSVSIFSCASVLIPLDKNHFYEGFFHFEVTF